jgi:antitoxin (DNA-binding transcriptional repressor) of toxin-antitoxin stability system
MKRRGDAMTRITIEEAESRLRQLIATLQPGEQLQITESGQPVARLVGEPSRRREPRQPGSAIGNLVIVSDDEEHLEDFKEYMP